MTLPALGGGARSVYSNNLGEFETRLFLFQHLGDQNAAIRGRGRVGWRSVRVVRRERRRRDGVGDGMGLEDRRRRVLSTWSIRRSSSGSATLRPKAANGASRTYETAGRTIQLTTGEVAGRPVVLYVDVPTGAPADVIDLNTVTLGK